jgi:CheY-like chemotaxis protein
MSSSKQSGRPTIMVVEDDDDLREELAELLCAHGFAVVSAENGAVALRALRQNADVRAIVLDVGMPVMNGATFRGEQLEDSGLASIPVVLLTGRDDITPLSMALGAAACVRKPDVGALVQAVEHYR